MIPEPSRWPLLTSIIVAAFLALFLVFALFQARAAHAQDVPAAAAKWKRDIVRQTRIEWGLDAPVATFAAQIEQESGFRHDARSPVGALGIAQFMPATATWIAGAYSALGPADPLNPQWAIRAMARYDLHLYERIPAAANDCERMAFVLSAYNGGERFRDRGIAKCSGDCDPQRWFGNVELVDDGRAPAAWRENRGYPFGILYLRQPRYVIDGWGRGMC